MSKVIRGTTEQGSNAAYDHICQICADRGEKEAVLFCTSCDLYMCQTCCDQHKKIPVAINHRVLEEKFGDIHTGKGLFEKRLIPTLTTEYPAASQKISLITRALRNYEKDYSNCKLFAVQNDPNSVNMLYFLFQECNNIRESEMEIRTVDHKYGYSTIFSNVVKSIYTLHSNEPCQNCNNMLYMIIPKTNKAIKYCCNHKATYIAFELQAGNQCYAITPFNNGLAIVVNLHIAYDLPNWKIEIMKHDGQPITEFYYDDDGQPLLDRPTS